MLLRVDMDNTLLRELVVPTVALSVVQIWESSSEVDDSLEGYTSDSSCSKYSLGECLDVCSLFIRSALVGDDEDLENGSEVHWKSGTPSRARKDSEREPLMKVNSAADEASEQLLKEFFEWKAQEGEEEL